MSDASLSDATPVFGPQVRSTWAWDPHADVRVMARERWLLPFLPAHAGAAPRVFPGGSSPVFAADDDTVFIVTAGYTGTALVPPSLLHAVDADGTARWTSELPGTRPLAMLVTDAGDVLVVGNEYFADGTASAWLQRVSPSGELRWRRGLVADPADPAASFGVRVLPALDWDGNVYVVVGNTVSSLDVAGATRWTGLLTTEASFGCREGGSADPFVLDDTLWLVGSCGVYSFSLDGEPRVRRSTPAEPPRPPIYYGATPTPSGHVIAGRDGGVDLLDAQGDVAHALDDVLLQIDGELLTTGDDAFIAVASGGVTVFDTAGPRWVAFLASSRGPLLDERGHLALLQLDQNLDVFDIADGALVAAYDTGRGGTSSLGVVLRPGQLVTPARLTPLGVAAGTSPPIAALHCVEVDLGLPAPSAWSRVDGGQRHQRRARSSPPTGRRPPP
ncbi:MAG: PQQ-like beta-propeller repeat protein [Deltaproteobacteria bacterium]|nr:PQQ-like beta-propeller repeat protein [Deltaproteobacteria bacterium]